MALSSNEFRRNPRSQMRALVVFLALALLSTPSLAQTITDGDTIKQGGVTYRLWGIDAPETQQTCPDGWPAGRLATTQLQTFIKGRPVVCEAKDTDRYGRTVAVCRAGGEDLGALMVRSGWRGRSSGTAATTSTRRREQSWLGSASTLMVAHRLGSGGRHRGSSEPAQLLRPHADLSAH